MRESQASSGYLPAIEKRNLHVRLHDGVGGDDREVRAVCGVIEQALAPMHGAPNARGNFGKHVR